MGVLGEIGVGEMASTDETEETDAGPDRSEGLVDDETLGWFDKPTGMFILKTLILPQ